MVSRKRQYLKVIAGFCVAFLLFNPSIVFAQPAPAVPDSTAAPHLDLSSTEASIEAHNSAPVQIQVGGALGASGGVNGGSSVTISPGQLVTPAQYLALSQVLAGQQFLVLSGDGGAVGGFASLHANDSLSFASLVIPQNVSLSSIGFNANSPLNILGNVNVLGSLYNVQTAPGMTSILNLGNLNVGSGALLSGALPTYSNFLGSVFASNGMTLNVLNNVTNMGTITTPGTLNINTGGSIVNQTMNNLQATIAASTVNLMAGSGNIINSGLITANANLNISTLLNQSLSIQNANGIMEALNGTINIRDTLFNGKSGTEILGGDFLSNEMNVHGGIGHTYINADNISGVLNLSSGTSSISTLHDLNLGLVCMDLDPVFSSAGTISITNAWNINGDTVVLAGKTIVNTAGGTLKTNGGNLFLVAGVNFTSPGAGATATLPGDTTINNQYTVTGASGNAGTINLNNAGAMNIDTNGGNVTLVSFGNGAITIPTVGAFAIDTSGGGNNGSVTVIGSNLAAGAINIGGINSGAGSTGGAVTITGAAPTMPSGNVQFTVTGATTVAVKNSFAPSAVLSATPISVGAINANGKAVSISTAGTINAGAINTLPTAGSGGAISLSGTTLTLGTLQANAAAIGKGGDISITTSQNFTLGSSLVSSKGGSTSGDGGKVSVLGTGAAAITLGSPASITLTPTRGAGGSLEVSTNTGAIVTPNSATALDLNANGIAGDNFNGGTLTLKSTGGAAITASAVNGQFTVNAKSFGNGSGGDVSFITSGAGTVLNNVSTGVLTINAQSTGAGAGGNIILTSGSGNIISGLKTGTVNLNAGSLAAGTGGLIQVNTTGSVFATSSGSNVSMSSSSTSGKGGNIWIGTTDGSTIARTGNLGSSTKGTLNLAANGATGGGNIFVASAATALRGTIDANASAVGNGGIITIDGNSLMTGFISADAGTVGKGGTVSLSSRATTNYAAGGGFAANRVRTISAEGGSTSGDGGTLILAAPNAGVGYNVGPGGNIDLSPTNGAGGNFDFSSNGGNIVLASTTYNLNAAGAGNNNGGTAQFSGGNVRSAATNSNVVINANGTNNGKGGDITYTSSTGGAFFVNTTTGSLTVNAKSSGSGNGGNVTLTSNTGSMFNALSSGSINFNVSSAGTGAGGKIQITTTGNVLNAHTGTSNLIASSTSGAGGNVWIGTSDGVTATPVGTVSPGSGNIAITTSGSSSGGVVSVFANSTVRVSGGINAKSTSALATPGVVTIQTAGATKTLTVGNIDVSSSLAQGGVINLKSVGGAIQTSAPTGTVTLNSSGATAAGGINVTSTTGAMFSNLTTGALNLASNSAGAGTAGNIIFSSISGTVMTGLSTGQVNIDVNNTGSGNAGLIQINSSGNVFTMSGAANAKLNATSTAGDGGRVWIGTSDGSTATPTGTIGNGTNGFLTITTNGADSPGQIFLASKGGVAINGGINSSSTVDGVGGTPTIQVGVNQAITIGGTSTLNAAGANQNGGVLVLATSGTGVIQANSAAAAVSINANGSGNGAGGDVTLQTGTGAIFSNVTTGTVNINANSAGTANAGNITLKSTSGAMFTGLNTGQANLSANNTLGAAGGSGGVITVNSTGAVVGFSNNAGKANFLATSVSGMGGTVSVGNLTPIGVFGNATNGQISINTSGASSGGIISVASTNVINIRGTVNASSTVSGAGGSISLSGTSLTLGSSAGNPVLSANGAGNSAGSNGGTINVSANAGNLTINGTVNATGSRDVAGSQAGGDLTLLANNATVSMSGATNTINVSAIGHGDGGTVSVTGATLSLANVLANGGGATKEGNGGQITLTDSNTGVLTIGNAAFAAGSTLLLSARGAQGKGDGGTIIANTAGTAALAVSNSLNLDVGTTSGNGGTIALNSKGSGNITLPFAGGTWNINGNGAVGESFDGGQLLITSTTGSVIPSATTGILTVNTNGFGDGNGGTISFNSISGSFLSTLTTGTINLNANAPANGKGGNVSLTSTGAATLFNGLTGGNVNINASSSGSGNGGNISLSTGSGNILSTLTTSGTSGKATFNANSASGNGGNITINSTGTIFQGAVAANAFTLNAKSTTAAGGHVWIGTTDGTNAGSRFASLNNGGAASLTIDASGAEGPAAGTGASVALFGGSIQTRTGTISATSSNNGSKEAGSVLIDITNGSTLTLGNAVDVSSSNGKGGSITIVGAGNAIVSTNTLSAKSVNNTGDPGGSISITTNTGALTNNAIDVSATNGNAGTVNLKSTSGLITANNGITATGGFVGATTQTGGNVTIETGGSITTTNNLGIINVSSVSDGHAGNVVASGAGLSLATITANGAAGFTGNGGQVSLTSVNALSVGNAVFTPAGTMDLQAKGGGTGDGGSISVKSGNMTLAAANVPTVAVTNGNGGQINLTSTGTITFPAAAYALSASAAGANSSAANLGAITIDATGGIVTPVGSAVSLSANGGVNGKGGSVTLQSGGVTNIGLAQFGAIDARGGTTKGDGGSINVLAGGGITGGSGGNFLVDAQGGNGAGGSITLKNALGGTAANQAMQIGGSLQANGNGVGSGGIITITYNQDGTGVLTVGNGAVGNSFIGGSINADGGASGGTVNITNQYDGAGVKQLSIDMPGAGGIISANGTVLGNINLNTCATCVPAIGALNTVQPVIVTGGMLTGVVNATGTTVSINPSISTSANVLTVGTIVANAAAGAGFVSLVNNASVANNSISIPATGSITATGNVDLISNNINLAGTVNSGKTVNYSNGKAGNLAVGAGLNISNTAGAGNTVAVTGITIQDSFASAAPFVAFSGNQIFDPGAANDVTISTNGAAASTSTLRIADGTTLSIAGGNATSGFSITGAADAASNLNLTVDTTVSNINGAAISTNGGAIAVQGNGTGAGTITVGTTGLADTLNLNGGPATFTSKNAAVNTLTTLSSSKNLTMNVNGGTLTNNGAINVAASGPNPLSVNSTGTLNLAGVGTFNANGGAACTALFKSTGTMSLDDAATLTFGGANLTAVNFQTPTFNMNGAPNTSFTVMTAGAAVNIDNGVGALTVGGTNGVIATNNGQITVQGSSVNFNANGTSTFNSGTAKTLISENAGAGNITISNTSTLASNGLLALHLNGGTLNFGGAGATISQTSANTNINILNPTAAGSFTIAGKGAISLPAVNPGSTNISVAGGGGNINFASDANVSINNGPVNISSNNLTFLGAGSTSSGISANGVVTLDGAGQATFTINSPGATNTGFISTPSALNVNLAANNLLVQGAGSVQLNGAPTIITSKNTTITTSSLSSTGLFEVQANNGVLSNNGAISSSANGTGLTISSTGTLGLDGTGTLDSNSAGASNMLFKSAGTMSLLTTAALTANGANLTGVVFNTPTLNMNGAGTFGVTTNGASASVNNGAGNPITIGGTGGTLSTNNGNLAVSGTNVVFNGAISTLNAGTAKTSISQTAPGGSISIADASTVKSNSNLEFNVNGGTINFNNGGSINQTTAANTITLQDPTASGSIALSGKGNITAGATGGTKIAVAGAGGAITFNPAAVLTIVNGPVAVSANNITFGAGADSGINAAGAGNITIDGAAQAQLTINAPGAGKTGFFTSSGTTTINQGANDLLVQNAGTVQLNGAGSIISKNTTVDQSTLSSTGAMQIAANGGTLNVDNNAVVQVGGSGATPLLVTSTGTLALAGTGTYSLNGGAASDAMFKSTGAMTVNNAANLTINGANLTNVTFETPSFNMNGTGKVSIATAGATAALKNAGGGAITVGGSGGTFSTNSAEIDIRGTSVGFNGTGTTTFDAGASQVTVTETQAAGSISLVSGLILASPSTMEFNMNGGTFDFADGAISQTGANKTVTFRHPNAGGSFTLDGKGSVTVPGATPGAVNISTAGAGSSVILGSSLNLQVNGAGALNITTPTLQMNNGAAIAATGVVALTTPVANGNMLVNGFNSLAANSTATISTTGTGISASGNGNGNLTFGLGGAATSANLGFNKALFTTDSTGGGTTTIQSNVQVESDNNILMRIAGNPFGTTVGNNGFVNDGIVTSSKAGGSITLESARDLTFGNGVANPGVISFSGGASGTITATAPIGSLTFLGSQEFAPGAAGSTVFNGKTIQIGANVTESVTQGSSVLFDTPTLILGDKSSISTVGNATLAVNIGKSSALSVLLDNASSNVNATIQSGGGAVTMAPTAGNILFGLTTVNLNTGKLAISGANTQVISTAGNVAVNGNTTLEASGAQLNIQVNNVAGASSLINDGTLSSTLGAGKGINVGSTDSALTIAGIAGTGTWNTFGSSVNISNTSAANSNLIFGNKTQTFTGGGDLNLTAPVVQFNDVLAAGTNIAGGASVVNFASQAANTPLQILLSSSASTIGVTGFSKVAASAVNIAPDGNGSLTMALAGAPSTLTAGTMAFDAPVSATSSGTTTIGAGLTVAGNNTISFATTGQDINVNGAISSSGVGAAGTVNLDTTSGGAVTGVITITGSTTGTNVNLTANGAVASVVTINGTVNGSNSVTVKSGGTITDPAGTVLTKNLTFASAFGAVNLTGAGGVSASDSIVLDGKTGVSATGGQLNTIALTAKGGTGGVTINDTNATQLTLSATNDINVTDTKAASTVTLNSSSSSNGALALTLTDTSSLTVGGALSGKTITLAANKGGITQNAGATIIGVDSVSLTAGAGSVVLANTVQATTAATGVVSVTSSAGITDAGLGNINAANINLKSTAGNINLTVAGLTASNSINLDGSTGVISTGGQLNTAALTAKGGTGLVTISDTNATQLTLSAAGDINVTDTKAGSTVTLNASSSTAGAFNLILTDTSSLTVDGAISGKTISLSANKGGITQNLGATVIGVDSVSLTAGAGSVVLADTIQATTAGTGLVNVTSSAAITDAGLGNINAANINLKSTGANINLTASGLTASNTINLDGSTGVVSTGGLLSTVSLTAKGGSGVITVSDTNATQLTLTAASDINVTDSKAGAVVTLNASSSMAGALNLTLTDTSSLTVGGAISGKTIALAANKAGITQNAGATIIGVDSVSLTAGAGSVVLADAVQATTAGTGVVDVTSSAGITDAGLGNISAANINLKSTAGNINLTVAGLTASNSINLDGSTGVISTGGLLNTAALTAKGGTGLITISDTNATQLTLTADGAVNVTDSKAGANVTLNASSSTNAAFNVTLTDTSSLTVGGAVSGKTIALAANKGGITQNAGGTIIGVDSVSLTAGAGSVVLADTVQATTAGTGVVNVTSSAGITDAGLGNISAANINLKSTAGNINLTVAGLTASNTINLDGSTGVISTGGLLDTAALTAKGGTGLITISDTNATQLTLTAAGAVNVTDSKAGSNVTLNASSSTNAAFNVTLTDTSSLTVGGAVSGKTIALAANKGGITQNAGGTIVGVDSVSLTAGAGSVVLADAVQATTAGTGVVNVTSSAGITDAGLGNISAANINLKSTAGNINLTVAGLTASNSINLDGSTGVVSTGGLLNTAALTAKGGTGLITINDTNATQLTLAADGAVNVTDSKAGANVTLNASSSTNAAFNVTLTDTSSLTVGGAISGKTIALAANKGGITQNAGGTIIGVDSVSLTAGAGSVVLADTVQATTAGTGVVNVTSSAGITDAGLGNISAANINLKSTAGNINLTVAGLTASNTINLDGSTGVISTGGLLDTAALTAKGGTGLITISDTNATQLTLTAAGAVNVTDSKAGANVTLNASSSTNAAFNVTLTDTSSLAVGGAVSGKTIALAANKSGITQNAGGTIIGVDSVSLTAGAGSIVLADTVQATTAGTGVVNVTSSAGITDAGLGNISAAIINLKSTAGNINLTAAGLIASNTINLDGSTGVISTGGLLDTVALSANGGTGLITINDTNATQLTLSAAGAINLTDSKAGSNVTLNASSSTNAAFNVTLTDTSSLTVGGAVSGKTIALAANKGGITQNAGGTIIGVDSVSLTAGAGSVVLSDVVQATTAGTGVVNVTSSAGITDAGLGNISAANVNLKSTTGSINLTVAGLTASNTINLDGSTGVISTGGLLNTAGLTAQGGTGLITINDTNATQLTLTADGAVNVTDSKAGSTVNLNASSSTNAAFNVTLTDTSSLTVGGAVSGKTIALAANKGGITQNASGTIIGVDSVSLTAGAGSVVLADTVQATTAGTGVVNVTSSAGITDAGLGNINAANINLKSIAGNINLTVAGLTASNTINLDGSTGVISSGGLLDTAALTAKGGTGLITISDTNATQLTLAAAGAVNVTDSKAGANVTLNASSSTNAAFNVTLTDTSSLTVDGAVSGKTIALAANKGGITQNAGGTIIGVDSVSLTAGAGGVVLADTVQATTAGTGVVNVTSSAGITDAGLGNINASNINLKSTAGNINLTVAGLTASNTINLDGSTGVISTGGLLNTVALTAKGGTGLITINDTNATQLTLAADGAVNVIDSKAGANVTLNASSSTNAAFNVTLTDTSSLIVGGAITGKTIALAANKGGITQNAGGTIIGVDSVSLTAGADSVVLVDAVQATAAGTGVVNVTSSAGITDAGLGNISAANINLKSTGAAINLTAAGLIATDSITLDGSTGVVSTGGLLDTAALTAKGGSGLLTINDTNATQLTLTAAGAVNVIDSKAGANVTLNASGSTNAAFNLTLTDTSSLTVDGAVSGKTIALAANQGGITQNVGGTIIGVDSVALTAGAGGVVLADTVQATTAGTGVVSLTSSAGITDAGLGNISAANINLKSTAGNINLTVAGLTASNTINLDGSTGVISTGGLLDTAALTANGGTGAINISDTNALNLTLTAATNVNVTDSAAAGKTIVVNASKGGTAAVNVFNLTASNATINTVGQIDGYDITLDASNGSLTLGAGVIGTNSVTAKSSGTLLVSNFSNVSAPNISLITTLPGNDIVIDSAVNASTSITLNSAGAIDRNGAASVLTSKTVNLTAGTTIGSNASPILTSTSAAGTALTINSAGDAFVTENTGVARLGASTVGGALTLNSATSVTTTGNVTSAGFNLNSKNLQNDNVINAGALFDMNGTSVLIGQTASGTITATTIRATGTTGGVDITQGNLNGTFTGSAATNFSAVTSVGNLTASGITGGTLVSLGSAGDLVTNNSIGAISSTGGNVSLTATGNNTNDGTISAATGVLMQSGLNLTNNGTVAANGGSLQATSSGGDMIFAAASVSTATQDIILNSSGKMNFNADAVNGSTVTAFNNLTMNADDTITVGAVGGAAVNLSAGRSTTSTLTLMPAGTIISNGNLNINSKTGVQINDNNVLTSHGGQNAANTGDLTITSGGAIAVGKNNNLSAFGGDLWFNAEGNLSIDKGSQLNSVGKISDGGGSFITTKGLLLPDYFGGRMGLFAGDRVGTNPTALLDAMVMDRSTANQFNNPDGVPFNQFSANYKSSGGSIMTIINTSSGAVPNIDPDLGNVYTLTGGVMMIQQVGTASISYDPDFTVIGPTLFPPPPPPTPSPTPNGGNGGLGPLALNLPGFTNQGVPTDRILINVDFAQQNVANSRSLTVGDRRTWFVAEGPEQPFILEGVDDTIIVGQEGTTLAMSQERTLVIEQGKIVALVGAKTDLSIETSMGVVKVPASGVVIVDSTNPKLVRVINLTSVSAQMNVSNGDKISTINIEGGEELVVAADGIGSAELVPQDGFNRKSIAFTSNIAGKKLSKNGIDRRQIVEQERLLACGGDKECLTKKRVDALKAELGAPVGPPKSINKLSGGISMSDKDDFSPAGIKQLWKQAQKSLMKPVAFSSNLGATAATTKLLSTLSVGSAILKHRGAEMELMGDKVQLKRGEILVNAEKKTIVRAGESTIAIDAGTIALVSKDNLVVKVRNVWEPKQGSVKQFLGKNHVELSAGQESIIGKDQKMIAAEYKHDAIGRRQVRHLDIGANRVSTSEFSIITLMASSPVLNALVLSKESQDMHLTGKMLKMAACIQSVTGSHGTYTNMVSDR